MPPAQRVVTRRGAPAVPFVGAVLCGGASRRMGRDKALLPVAGKPLALVAVEALRAAGAREVLAIGGDVAPLGSTGVRLIRDDHPGEGPLGGIVTALSAGASAVGERDGVVVVLTCDLPWISGEEVAAVVAALAGAPAAMCAAPLVDDRPQFLTAAYRGRALEPLAAAFAARERAVRRAVLPLPWTAVAGLDPRRLRDADTPADLPPEAVGSAHPGE